MSAKHLTTSQWGVGASLAKPPTRPALKELADALEVATGSADYLARQLAYAELCPRKGLRSSEIVRLDEACRSIASSTNGPRWPRFVARSLREEDLPELNVFVDEVSKCQIMPANAAAWSEAEPLEMGVVVGADPYCDTPDPYKTKSDATGRFLIELLGDKKSKPSPEPLRKTVSPPPAPVNRNVMRPVRPTNAASSASAFQGNQHIVRLGRSNAANRRQTSSGSLKGDIRASAAMSRLRADHAPRTMTVLGDEENLPVPNDSLPARKKREEERLKRKEEESENKRKRREEKYKRDQEKRMEERKKKKELREERNERRRIEGGYDDDEDELDDVDEVIDLDGGDELGGFSGGTKRVTARPGSPASKRTRGDVNLSVPRREVRQLGRARTGDEAHRQRARLSTNPIDLLNEFDMSQPQMPSYEAGDIDEAQPPTVVPLTQNTENGDAGEEEEVKKSPYEEAVGEQEKFLTLKERADIRKFVMVGSMPASWFDGGQTREIVLQEDDDVTLVLRCKSDGSWQRVRLSSADC